MRMNFDSASSITRTAELPQACVMTFKAPSRRAPAETSNVRPVARPQLLCNDRLENAVWLAVGICAAATLFLSLFT